MKRLRASVLAAFIAVNAISAQSRLLPYQDAKNPLEARVQDLLQRLTTDEKISLLGNASPGVDRLDVPEYNWWSEALHGVARNGEATIFPQAIGMAATFDTGLMQRVGDAARLVAISLARLREQDERRSVGRLQ